MKYDLALRIDREKIRTQALDRMWHSFYSADPIALPNSFGRLINASRSRFPKLTRSEFEQEFSEVVEEYCRKVHISVSELNGRIRIAMKGSKVFCLSDRHDNVLMWSHYAQSHEGAVFKLACIPERDSVWGSAMPVRYADDVPPFADDELLIGILSGESSLSQRDILDTFVTTKSKAWEYEREWRVVLHFTDPAKNTQDIPFWPEEVTAVYLGCRMPAEQKEKIAAKLRMDYPHAEILEAVKKNDQFSLEFRKFRF